MSHILLFSNSTNPGQAYFEHAWSAIEEYVGQSRSVLFVPFADPDPDDYLDFVTPAFVEHGYQVSGLHQMVDPVAALADAEIVFTGGGNTFLLLRRLRQLGILGPLRDYIERGGRYFGASAGSNLACPTIHTTNDMPIVDPGGFAALNAIPFQLNCHYLDPNPELHHNGESRVTRIRELHQIENTPVLGLREGTWLDAQDGRFEVRGRSADPQFGQAVWIAPGNEPQEVSGDITGIVDSYR